MNELLTVWGALRTGRGGRRCGRRSRVVVASAVALLAACLGMGCRNAPEAPPGPASPASGAIRLTDDLGNALSLAAPAKRIVSLSPNLTEAVYAIGAGDCVVGITDFCKYPPEVSSKPRIGGIINPVLEKVVALKPDLVLAARGNDPQFLKRLKDMHINVAGFDPQAMGGVLGMLRDLGKLTGRDAQADAVCEALTARIADIKSAARAPQPAPRVLFILEWQPLFVAGPKSFVDDMIRVGGGENVVRGENLPAGANADSPWPQVSAEKMIALDPQVIIFARMQGAGVDTSEIIGRMRNEAAWKNVSAIKDNRLYAVDDDLVTIPGPRLVDGLEQIVKLVGGGK